MRKARGEMHAKELRRQKEQLDFWNQRKGSERNLQCDTTWSGQSGGGGVSRSPVSPAAAAAARRSTAQQAAFDQAAAFMARQQEAMASMAAAHQNTS